MNDRTLKLIEEALERAYLYGQSNSDGIWMNSTYGDRRSTEFENKFVELLNDTIQAMVDNRDE